MRFLFVRRTYRCLASASLLILAGLLPVLAQQGPSMAEADKKALLSCTLTLDRVDKTNAICQKLMEAIKTDPQIAREMRALDAEKGGHFFQSDEVFNKKAPHAVAIIKSGGLEIRDFILGIISTTVASICANLGRANATELPDFVPLVNVELAGKNKTKFDDATRSIDELHAAARALRQ